MESRPLYPFVALGGRFRVAAFVAGAMLLSAGPASALVVYPFFAGHGTIDATTSSNDWTVYDGRLQSLFDQSSIDIDVAHGVVDDGGISSRQDPGVWTNDYDVWGPLVNRMNIALGGEVTYGFPVSDVFAVTWIDVANRIDPTIRNTFQVVFVGASGFHTNAGLAIQPGSVIFAYGAPTDPYGTVHLSASTPAGIGILFHGNVTTLESFGIGDVNGVLSLADAATLQSSGDPFLFNKRSGGFEEPVSFDSVLELVPEPSTDGLLVSGLLGLVVVRRRSSPRPIAPQELGKRCKSRPRMVSRRRG